jgi:hypothetical protein
VVEEAPRRAIEAIGVALPHHHDVDVAGVVQLRRSELAHADHRQPIVGPEVLADEAMGPRQHVDGHRRQAAGRALQGVRPREVAGGEAEELAPLPRHEVLDRRHRDRRPRRAVVQHGERPSVGPEEPPEAAAGGEHRDQRRRHAGVRRDLGVERRSHLGESREGDAHPIRVGGPLDEVSPHVGPAGSIRATDSRRRRGTTPPAGPGSVKAGGRR